jgi:hypothetical protein
MFACPATELSPVRSLPHLVQCPSCVAALYAVQVDLGMDEDSVVPGEVLSGGMDGGAKTARQGAELTPTLTRRDQFQVGGSPFPPPLLLEALSCEGRISGRY